MCIHVCIYICSIGGTIKLVIFPRLGYQMMITALLISGVEVSLLNCKYITSQLYDFLVIIETCTATLICNMYISMYIAVIATIRFCMFIVPSPSTINVALEKSRTFLEALHK